MPYGISPHPSLLCGVRQISTNVANLLKRANALSFASRLGRGVAPLDALFFSLPRVLSAERGENKGAAVFTAHFVLRATHLLARELAPASHCLAHRCASSVAALTPFTKYRTRPLGVAPLRRRFALRSKGFPLPSPRGARIPGVSLAEAKKKGLRSRRKP